MPPSASDTQPVSRPGGQTSAATPALSRKVARARTVTLVGMAALIVLCLAWELWLAPTGRGTLAVKVLPLLLCVMGLWRNRLFTYRWLSLLLWLYVLESLVRGTTEQGLSQALAVGEGLLSLLIFVSCTLYIRQRQRDELKASAELAASSS